MACTPQPPKPIPPTVTNVNVLLCLHRAYVDYLVVLAALGDEFPELCEKAYQWYCDVFRQCLSGSGS